jgi:hypothetical protein
MNDITLVNAHIILVEIISYSKMLIQVRMKTFS